jgi:hypothetical protein
MSGGQCLQDLVIKRSLQGSALSRTKTGLRLLRATVRLGCVGMLGS